MCFTWFCILILIILHIFLDGSCVLGTDQSRASTLLDFGRQQNERQMIYVKFFLETSNFIKGLEISRSNNITERDIIKLNTEVVDLRNKLKNENTPNELMSFSLRLYDKNMFRNVHNKCLQRLLESGTESIETLYHKGSLMEFDSAITEMFEDITQEKYPKLSTDVFSAMEEENNCYQFLHEMENMKGSGDAKMAKNIFNKFFKEQKVNISTELLKTIKAKLSFKLTNINCLKNDSFEPTICDLMIQAKDEVSKKLKKRASKAFLSRFERSKIEDRSEHHGNGEAAQTREPEFSPFASFQYAKTKYFKFLLCFELYDDLIKPEAKKENLITKYGPAFEGGQGIRSKVWDEVKVFLPSPVHEILTKIPETGSNKYIHAAEQLRIYLRGYTVTSVEKEYLNVEILGEPESNKNVKLERSEAYWIKLRKWITEIAVNFKLSIELNKLKRSEGDVLSNAMNAMKREYSIYTSLPISITKLFQSNVLNDYPKLIMDAIADLIDDLRVKAISTWPIKKEFGGPVGSIRNKDQEGEPLKEGTIRFADSIPTS